MAVDEQKRIVQQLKKIGFTQVAIANLIGTYPSKISALMSYDHPLSDAQELELKEVLLQVMNGAIKPQRSTVGRPRTEADSSLHNEQYVSTHKRDILAEAVTATLEADGSVAALYYLRALNIPQVVIAILLGVSAQYISNYINGRLKMSPQVALKLYQLIERDIPDDLPFGMETVKQQVLNDLEPFCMH